MNLANKVTTKIVIISIKVSFHIKTNLANEIILYNFPPRPKPIYKFKIIFTNQICCYYYYKG